MDNNRIAISSIAAVPVEEPIYLALGQVTIEVRPRITFAEQLEMMQHCIDILVGDKPFLSAPMARLVKDFAILQFYTNLDADIVPRTTEEIYSMYDAINAWGIMENILAKIDPKQIEFFETNLDATVNAILAYRNSAKGMLDSLVEEADGDVSKMQKALAMVGDEDNLRRMETLLKYAAEIQGPDDAAPPAPPQAPATEG